MAASVPAGAYLHRSHAVVCGFSFDRLQEATSFLFGSDRVDANVDEVEVSPPNWSDTRAFRHLTTYLTFLHEVGHVRHLSASSLGVAWYVLAGRELGRIAPALKALGARLGGAALRLPILQMHSYEPEVAEIEAALAPGRRFGSILHRPPREMGPRPIQALPEMWEELAFFSTRVAHREYTLPDIHVPEDTPLDLSPGLLSTAGVVEGLARCNEYIATLQFDAPLEMYNRYMSLKHHGDYGRALSVVEDRLGLRNPYSIPVTAALLDWALQAPTLPYLLDGRDEVELHELLPAWRFVHLGAQFASLKLTPEDVTQSHDEAEKAIFAELDWESPRHVAGRLLSITHSLPDAPGTRLAVVKLLAGAHVRLRAPMSLLFPLAGEGVEELQACVGVFSDDAPVTLGAMPIVGEGLTRLWIGLLDDVIVDAVLLTGDLGRPRQVARAIASVPGASVSGEDLLANRLEAILGSPLAHLSA